MRIWSATRAGCSSRASTTTGTSHSRKLVLSGRTEADRKVTVVARTGGVLTELRVRRGDRVNKGDVIAVLSDEAREAQVAQASALLTQRKAELVVLAGGHVRQVHYPGDNLAGH